mmetsp:Transcript_24089/g.35030  ORF Transcript_24089/g.35030 Transcript_24089/m.35030 type:complete len:501 (-) Transcript_24089:1124-2626(-)
MSKDQSNKGRDYGGITIQTPEEQGGGGGCVEFEPTKAKPSSWWKTEFAGMAGNILEWYDFALFGFFDDVISANFFPPNQPGHSAMIESFLVFGGAFLMRPIGGVLLGQMGDKYGRKVALETSVFLMAFPTFFLGCLPTYSQVGWLSTVLLILVRLMQGLSVGGQLVSSLVFLLEHEDKKRWGFHGSAVMAAACSGTLLGGLVGTAMRAFVSKEALYSWAWRVPFLCGIIVGWSGYYLKHHVENDGPPPMTAGTNAPCDDSSHIAEKKDEENGTSAEAAKLIPEADGGSSKHDTNQIRDSPLKIALSKPYRRSLLSCCLVPTVWGGGFYIIYIWMAIFMEDVVSPPIPHAFSITSASLFACTVVLFPFAGMLSDIYGRVRIMAFGAISIALFGPVALQIINDSAQRPVVAFMAQFMLGNMLSLWAAPMCAWMVESFPPEARLTAVSIGYNTGMGVAGGISPGLATYMVDLIGPCSPGYLISFLAFISLIGLYIAPSSCVGK